MRYGVELDKPLGYSDGTWKGKQFFQCNHWCGVFLKERERIMLIKSSQPNSKSMLVTGGVVLKSAAKVLRNNGLAASKDNQLRRERTYSDDDKESLVSSPRLLNEEDKDIRATFKFFDTNKDRKIDAKELQNVMKLLGSEIDDTCVKILMNDFDLNNNGTIEWDEFLKMMKQIG